LALASEDPQELLYKF